jgi:hypothetical protein
MKKMFRDREDKIAFAVAVVIAAAMLAMVISCGGCFSSPAPSQVPQMPPVTVVQKEGVAVPMGIDEAVSKSMEELSTRLRAVPRTPSDNALLNALQSRVDFLSGYMSAQNYIASKFGPSATLPTTPPIINSPPASVVPPAKPVDDKPATKRSTLVKIIEIFMWCGVGVCLLAGAWFGYKLSLGKVGTCCTAAAALLLGGYFLIDVVIYIWWIVWGLVILVALYTLYRYHDQVYAKVKELWNSDKAKELEAHVAALPAHAAADAQKVIAKLETSWAESRLPEPPKPAAPAS